MFRLYKTLEPSPCFMSNNPLVSEVIDVSSGSDAVRAAEEYKPHIALLDIELDTGEGINGIDVAKMIQQINPDIYFVFVTGYSRYALDSFRVHPYDYILKPFKSERVMEVITALAARVLKEKDTSKNTDKIRIKTGDEILFIRPEEILFIERQGKEILIHTFNNIHKIDIFLNELEEILPQNFLRVHKSFIVNVDKIRRIREVSRRSYEIEFYDYDKPAQMSRCKFEEYKDIFCPSK